VRLLECTWRHFKRLKSGMWHHIPIRPKFARPIFQKFSQNIKQKICSQSSPTFVEVLSAHLGETAVGCYIFLYVVWNVFNFVVDYGTNTGKTIVLSKKARNHFQEGRGNVHTNIWTRGDPISKVHTVFVINTNFVVTLLLGNK